VQIVSILQAIPHYLDKTKILLPKDLMIYVSDLLLENCKDPFNSLGEVSVEELDASIFAVVVFGETEESR
jgi:hypothetical protein